MNKCINCSKFGNCSKQDEEVRNCIDFIDRMMEELREELEKQVKEMLE